MTKRLITILTLVALLLACIWGSVLLSQEFLDWFGAEEQADLNRDEGVAERDDDDDDGNHIEQNDDNDDDADEVEADDQFTGTIPVSPDTANPESLAEISAAEAEQIALEEQPDAQMEEVGLEVENGYLVYEVELNNGVEIIVDAGNGDILSTKVDD
jgi:uncharacterized membrane protein YkoI